ncbi:MAG: SLBB domain-containing protein [Verrucomicrobiota bacterium]
MSGSKLFGFAVAVAVLAGCRSTGPQFDAQAPPSPPAVTAATNLTAVGAADRIDPLWLHPPTNRFTLGPGDRLDIEVVGDASSRGTTRVGPDGKIYYFLLPGLNVWGLTLTETKSLLEKELTMYFKDPPRVSLSLSAVESKRVWLLGRLNTPGVYTLTTPMTLLEAISLAGGPGAGGGRASGDGANGKNGGSGSSSAEGTSGSREDAADLRRSFVIRNGRLLPVDFYRLLREGDMTQNIYLQPDDFVYLPTATARDVYVLGAVGHPRAVNFSDKMTLVAAIANAGGTIKNGYLSHVAIVRGSLSEPTIAVVDYRAIAKGEAPDVWLEPHDIVYVPFTPYRTLTKYADLIVDTFVRTVGANEGARAVSRGAVPIGVNVPIGF